MTCFYAQKAGLQSDGVFLWAADEWRHPEAISMPMLMSADGPFAFATSRNSPGDPLPYEAPPARYFPDTRHDASEKE